MLTRWMSHSTRRSVALWWTIFSYGLLALLFLLLAADSAALADQIRLIDGTTIEADEAWEDAQGVWYRRGGVTHLLARARVRTIVRTPQQQQPQQHPAAGDAAQAPAPAQQQVSVVQNNEAADEREAGPVWIHLVGGARVEADEASETPEGVWYRHGNISAFIERARILRVEREPAEAAEGGERRRERRWSSGRPHIDALIRQNGAAYGVDPYLIFLVMEQESHFNARAVSPRGARGLMQLMPGTARRFGVRNPYDPAQNIRGGTRYLKDLMQRFGGRVDLVLASYNAGEGAVKRYGHRVPPYRETRNYVKRISQRYHRSQ